MRHLTLALLLFCVLLPVSEARPAHFGPYYKNTKRANKPKKYKARAAHKARRNQFKKFKKR
jgi:hypothetical protein